MCDVTAARWAISTAGDVQATLGMLWCSATQNRVYPELVATTSERRRRLQCLRAGLAIVEH